MAKKKEPIVKIDSKEVYEYIQNNPGCSVHDIADFFPHGNKRSIWSMVSALKKKGVVNNEWKGQWTAIKDTTKVKRSSATKNIKVAKLVIEIDISLNV